MRRLLEVDRPVTPLNDEEIETLARENYRWNFTVNFMDGATFWFGLSFISYATILPLFVSKLSSNLWPIALLAVIGQSSWYLPQLFAAGPTERLARNKPVVVNLGLFSERLPLWFLPVAALVSLWSPTLALIIFFVAYAAHGLGAGAIGPAWADMLARIFPLDRRGRFFGITSFVGTGLGAIGAIFSGWLLGAFVFPMNFFYAFTIAAFFITISWFFIAMTREPAHVVPEAVKNAEERAIDAQDPRNHSRRPKFPQLSDRAAALQFRQHGCRLRHRGRHPSLVSCRQQRRPFHSRADWSDRRSATWWPASSQIDTATNLRSRPALSR